MKRMQLIKTLFLCALIGHFFSCSDDINTSNRYVFQEYTVASYLENHEQYSEFLDLLKQVPVSEISKTSMCQLLSARGNYTVFAPTNAAIHNYLDTLVAKEVITAPNWDAFPSERVKDSIRKVIVLNSVIDGGDVVRYETGNFPQKDGSEFSLSNMYTNKLSVYYADTMDTDVLVCDAPVDAKNRDILCINGVIHAMNAVVAPQNNSLTDFLLEFINGNRKGYRVAAMMVKAVGLMDTLSKIKDDQYEQLYLQGKVQDFTQAVGFNYDTDAYAPEHRFYGYTFFAETDDFWEREIGKPAATIVIKDIMDYLSSKQIYPNAKVNEEYTSEDNLLNQFLTYHIIPSRLTPDRLIYHYNERGYNPELGIPTVAMQEFYVTMGKRRLLKIFESRESNGVYLNRFPILDNRRRGSYHETSCPVEKEGILVGKTDRNGINNVRNAVVYPIEKLLTYDEQTRNNLGQQRIRFDMCAVWTEMTNNDIRCSEVLDARHQMVAIPSDNVYRYLSDVWMTRDTYFYYSVGRKNPGWHNYQGDETRVHGQVDMIVRMPPVPRNGVYEVRYSVTNGNPARSIVQFYWGSDMERLVPMGIPMDLRTGGRDRITLLGTSPSGMGWEPDTNDDEYNAEVDKTLRQNGYMKGARLYSAGLPGEPMTARDDVYSTRRILFKQFMEADKTYYIRFKQVLDNPHLQFYMDYMEYCPKEIYDNPSEPEDIW